MFPGTWAQRTPDKPALVIAETGRTTTYAELDERSLRLARVFADAGLVTGDVIALVSDNAPEAYEVYWAALRSGLYITAVNHHLSASEAAYIVNDCGAKAMVVSAAKSDLIEAMADLVDVPVRLAFGGEVPGCSSYAEALAAASYRAVGRPAARRRLPLLLGDHRAAEGHQAAVARHQGRRAGLSLRDDLRGVVLLRRGHRLSLTGAGLPRRSVALHGRDPGARRHRRADAALRRRGVPARRAGLPGHGHPGGPDDVRAAAQAARGGACVVRHVEPEDRRARSGSVPGRGQAADDGVARADRARVLREHGGQRCDVRRPGGLACPPRHGRQVAARQPSDLRPGGQGAAGGRSRHDLLRARRGAVHLPR